MRVLVTGSTGPTSSIVLAELKRRDIDVRGVIRSEDRADAARANGADETVVADLTDSSSLASAMEGVDGVFATIPAFPPDEEGLGLSMVEAAIEAGVPKFVFSGVYHPSLSLTNHAGKRPAEEALYDSDLDFTVLQPAMFMQTMAAAWPQVLETGVYAQPYSAEVRLTYVDYRDVAEVAAEAFAGDRLSRGTFELASGGMVTRVDIARLMSEVLGRRIEAETLPFDRFADEAGMPEGPSRDGFGRMVAAYSDHGFHGGNPVVLRALLGRDPRTLEAYLRELAA